MGMALGQSKKISMVHYIVVLLFCFGFRFLPGFAGITPLGMGILGSFIGAIYGWIFIDMLWTSFMALLAIGLSIGMNQMYAASLGSVTIIALLFCMPLIGVCNETGAFQWLIDKMLTNKFMQGKAWVTVWIILLISWFMGCHNPIIMCMIFCSFVTGICKQVGIGKNEKFPVFMYLGIAYTAMMGQILFPFISTGLTLIMAYNNMFPDTPLDFVKYLAFMIPAGIIMTTIYTLLMKFVFRVDASKVAHYENTNTSSKITKDQRNALIVFIVFIALNICHSLPLGPVKQFLGLFGLGGFIFAMLGFMMVFMKREDGSPFCDVEKLMKTVHWGQILMVGYIMVIAMYMNRPETGISAAMGAMLRPFTSLPPLVFVVFALLFACILTNVANNMIVVVLVMPVMFNFSSVIGMAPTGMICLLFLLAQFAIATPAASPVTAVAMTQELADASVMTKTALKIVPVLFIFSLVVGWPLAQILF